MFQCRNAMRIHFLYPGNRIKRLGRSRLSDVLNRRMALKTKICLLDVLKDEFNGWLRDFSRFRWAKCTHFLHLGNRKKWLSWCRLSFVLNRRIALRTQNLPSARLKRRLWSRWSDVSSCRWALRTYFVNSRNRKKWLLRRRLSYIK
jgi:hypothetical protein